MNATANTETVQSKTWWGDFEVSLNQSLRWRVGPLTLSVQRLEREWRVGYTRELAADPALRSWSIDVDPDTPDAHDVVTRYVFDHTTERVSVRPALADRPVVTRPVSTLNLQARQKTTFFVSSPLWLCVGVDPPDGKPLIEVPIVRPSDTWFGPSTRVGELCYATRTQGRMYNENVALQHHRAVSPLLIHNEAESTLTVERLKLPVPYLRLFADESGFLWTQEVTMHRVGDDAPVTLRIPDSAPPHAVNATCVSGAREEADDYILKRAITALFG